MVLWFAYARFHWYFLVGVVLICEIERSDGSTHYYAICFHFIWSYPTPHHSPTDWQGSKLLSIPPFFIIFLWLSHLHLNHHLPCNEIRGTVLNNFYLYNYQSIRAWLDIGPDGPGQPGLSLSTAPFTIDLGSIFTPTDWTKPDCWPSS